MRMSRFKVLCALFAVLSLVGVACSDEPTTSGDGNQPAEQDLLARITEDGLIRVATDQKYAPQSSFNTDTEEWEGFDIDVANEIAERLGVDIEIEHQDWEIASAGSWSDRWDMHVGSMTVTKERAEQLFDFTPAYYYTPASVAVHEENTNIQDVASDLDGKRVGAGIDTTYELYLNQALSIPGYTFDFVIDEPTVQTWDTDVTALENLALGDGVRIDAAISATPTIEQAIEDGLPIKIVGEPIFFEPLAVDFDKASPIDNRSLVTEVSRIIDDMHADGTLSELSKKWYGVDLTVVT